MRSTWRFTNIALGMAMITFMATGCIFGDDPAEPEDEPPVVVPRTAETADQAVDLLGDVYEERNLDGYRDLLSAEFEFMGQGGETFNVYRELQLTNKMFNEIAGNYDIVIGDITVEHLTPIGSWEPVPAEDPFFGSHTEASFRPYDIRIDFSLSNENLILKVEGLAIFYVIDEGSEDEPDFHLMGIYDQTQGTAKTESNSWTSVKLFFD